ncbi:hypothetical protein F2Q65_16775 [Thiohalocapsa marina]|uniref:Cytochrome c n=1 Tax=Thiohalocapsa marina TaxID=424902 RepID=A0A5M8FE86_9GAMM|nr:hypothetical protein [Thiohalocapsa marina]KAA6182977.1 hypothetical protein F2Q65_16775 [Thiohalocapsa marina]
MRQTLMGALFVGLMANGIATAVADDEEDLIGHMTRMQYFAHKLALSIDTGNQPLQAFYAHEVEEQIDGLLEIELFDDIHIAQLAQEYLVPRFETLEAAIKSADGSQASKAFDDLVEGCNRCHSAAKHAYIRIERRADNPFMQIFAP